jgi:eukaryotic-like serine/threonine-protein kinase
MLGFRGVGGDPSGADACLTEEDILAYVAGRADSGRVRIERHLAGCADCDRLVAAAASLLLPARGAAVPDTTQGADTSRGLADDPTPGGRDEPTAPLRSSREVPAFMGDERWEVRARLGEGGMGTVYEVLDRERGDLVAMKTLLHADPMSIFQFKQEFRSLADVAHPNLVSYYEMGTVDGTWFFTMELVRGVNVDSYLAAERARGRDRWLAAVGEVLTQLAQALIALHRAGKVHRDVKPSNVLVTPSGRVVLVDLGLVFDYRRRLHDARVAPGLVGTVPYMSPEQARGETVGTAADWYAYGALLYQLLAGRPPFEGASADILAAKVTDDPQPPSAHATDVPPALEALCLRLLERDPARRAGAAEVLAALAAGSEVDEEADGDGPFVGRAAALAGLRAAFDEARGGRAVVVNLLGPSGIGKTSLARRFLASVERQGAVTLQGRCYEGQLLPYRAIDELVDQLAHYLLSVEEAHGALSLGENARVVAEVFPVLSRVSGVRHAPAPGPAPDAEARKRRAFAGLSQLLALVARRAPLAVFLDDLQWGDRDSAGFLAELLGEGGPPFLLVLSHRAAGEGEARGAPTQGPLLDELRVRAPRHQVRPLELAPLAPEEAAQLARALVGTAARPEDADTVVRQAEGSPLFLHEMARWLTSGGRPSQSVTFEQLVAARTAELPPEALKLLQVAAVAGHPLAAHVAAAAADLPPPSPRLLGALRSARLVVTREAAGDTEIQPSHDRVRAAVVAGLPEAERRRWHVRLAETLEVAPTLDPQLVFEHFDAAGDRRAARYAVAAAEAAARALAFFRAAELYGRALALGEGPVPAALREELREKRAEALANAGHAAAAGAEYAAALRAAGPSSDVAALERRAAEQYLRGGRFDDGLAILRRVVARAGFRFPETSGGALAALGLARARLLWRGLRFARRDPSLVPPALLSRLDTIWPAIVGLSLVDPLRSAYFASHYTRMALEAGERDRLIRALGVEAAYLSSIGGRLRWAKSAALGRTLLELAAETEEPYGGAYANFAVGTAAFFAGDWPEALLRCDEAARRFRDECAGAAWEQATSLGFAHASLAYLGEVRELNSRLPRALAMVDERGDVYGAAVLRTGFNTLGLLAEGRTAEVRRLADEALARWTRAGFHAQHYMHMVAVAQAELHDGDGAAAERRVAAAWPQLHRAGYLRLSYVRVEARHLRARVALAAAAAASREGRAHRDGRLALAASEARALSREAFPSAAGFAAGLRAGVASLSGDAEATARWLGTAEGAFAAAGMQLHAAAARFLAHGTGSLPASDPEAFARVLLPGVRSSRSG